MKKLNVELGMLVRMQKNVVVEVPDDFDEHDEYDVENLLHDIYEADEGDGFDTEDKDFGCEEASHLLIGKANDNDAVQFELDEEGVLINRILLKEDGN